MNCCGLNLQDWFKKAYSVRRVIDEYCSIWCYLILVDRIFHDTYIYIIVFLFWRLLHLKLLTCMMIVLFHSIFSVLRCLLCHIWVFPKIGVPPNHLILIGFGTIINHPFWGTPIFGNTRIYIYTLFHILQYSSLDCVLSRWSPWYCDSLSPVRPKKKQRTRLRTVSQNPKKLHPLPTGLHSFFNLWRWKICILGVFILPSRERSH